MKRLIIIVTVLGVVAGAVAYAPHYLALTDKPVKADTVILLLGARLAPRKEEVFKLIEDGYARHLIIPAYGRVSDAGLFQDQTSQTDRRPDPSLMRGRIVKLTHYPKYYEDTHVEILEAKKMMDKSGFKKAIFVSSPYHMRRISIIAKKVFGEKNYSLTFVPSRYEGRGDASWFMDKRDRKLISSEYSKIVWFLLYGYLT